MSLLLPGPSADRALIPAVVQRGSSVVEIGCCNGHTTAAIAASGLAAPGRCLGVDHDELQLGLARSRWPELNFCRCDALDMSALRQLLLAQGFGAAASSPAEPPADTGLQHQSKKQKRSRGASGSGGGGGAVFRDDMVFFVDINGSRELKTLIPLLNSYAACFKPVLMVVKNWRLAHVVSSYELSSAVLAAASSVTAGGEGGAAGGVAAEEEAEAEGEGETAQSIADRVSQNEARIKLLVAENMELEARRAALLLPAR
jgi:hypothetical protein